MAGLKFLPDEEVDRILALIQDDKDAAEARRRGGAAAAGGNGNAAVPTS